MNQKHLVKQEHLTKYFFFLSQNRSHKHAVWWINWFKSSGKLFFLTCSLKVTDRSSNEQTDSLWIENNSARFE